MEVKRENEQERAQRQQRMEDKEESGQPFGIEEDLEDFAEDYLLHGFGEGTWEGLKTDEEINKHFRCLNYWRKQNEMLEMQLQDEIRRIQTLFDRKQQRLLHSIDYHENSIKHWMDQFPARKKAEFLHGKISRVKGRERVEEHEDWADSMSSEFYTETTVRQVDKRKILAWVRDTGEIPIGCDIVRGDGAYKIETQWTGEEDAYSALLQTRQAKEDST